MTSARAASLAPLHVIVPLRTLAGGKARLGEALDAEEREELVRGMLLRTLEILRVWPACARTHVVSPDPAVLRLARGPRVSAIRQVDDGLNEGLIVAREASLAEGAGAVLILPADLPLLEPSALDRLLDAADAALAAGSGRALVAIAPSDARVGTNALLLSPPGVIEPAFGTASFEAHARAAAKAGATLQIVTDPSLGFDLDTPEDLEILRPEDLADLVRLGREPRPTERSRP